MTTGRINQVAIIETERGLTAEQTSDHVARPTTTAKNRDGLEMYRVPSENENRVQFVADRAAMKYLRLPSTDGPWSANTMTRPCAQHRSC
jgi:hypothetical protein